MGTYAYLTAPDYDAVGTLGQVLGGPRTLGLGTFDYAVSTGVLHHLASPDAGLAAIRDVLAPAGGMGATSRSGQSRGV